MSLSRLLTILPVSVLLTSSVSASQDLTLDQRLTKLDIALEAARVEAHVPGMSIAIVKGDEIIWARGYGLADVEEQRPADEDTVYAIGSATKAFTATLVGMLVDDGKTSWDDPVTKYLPYFDLAVRSEDKNAECTLRDLLSHRHGFARMGILWFGGEVTRDEVLRVAARAEPWDDFRRGFHYCNVTYLAAGQAAGVADGTSWDELMVERIFEPLGMGSSTVTMDEARKDPRIAVGYRWNEVLETFERERYVSLDNVAPSGSVNSNVLDIAQWLRLQLGGGEVEGQRLIGHETLNETWAPQIEIEAGASYGLGWMLREHGGRKVVEHGGNINGFTAEVAMIPEEELGYVLLMNVSASPLRVASLDLVFDALLDEKTVEVEEAPTSVASTPSPEELRLEDHVGVYVANFARFRDAEFEIYIEAGALAVDIPGQMSSGLHAPDSEGLWVSVLSDRVAVSFDYDELWNVIGLNMHTNGFQFEVPRKGVELDARVETVDLESYVGTYIRQRGGKRVELMIVNGVLTMEDKGNRLAFKTPLDGELTSLRARADQGATFTLDEDGIAKSFMYRGSSGDRLFTRLPNTPVSGVPTVGELMALRGTEARQVALDAAGGTKLEGKVWVPQSGVHGTVTILTRGDDRYANHMDFGKFGRISTAARGEEAWSYNPMRGYAALMGAELLHVTAGHPNAVEGDWRNYFSSIEVIGSGVQDGRVVHVVRLKQGELPSRTYRVDAETGDVLRVNLVAIFGAVRTPMTIAYSDFREQGGVRRAMRVEFENQESGRIVLTLEELETGLQLDESVFSLEAPDAGK